MDREAEMTRCRDLVWAHGCNLSDWRVQKVVGQYILGILGQSELEDQLTYIRVRHDQNSTAERILKALA